MAAKNHPTLKEAEKGGIAFPNFLNHLFNQGALLAYKDDPLAHPLITLNALKNIMGDDREHPSTKLLGAAESLVSSIPAREDDQFILNGVAGDGIGQTVFLMDLEDACQSGDGDAMDREAAKVHWASQNSPAVLDSLMEISLQNFERLGPLSYHLQRAFSFQDNKTSTWTFIRAHLGEIKKASLPDPHEMAEVDLSSFLDPILSTPDLKLWIQFAAASRLWEGDYVRITGFRREISNWLSTLSYEHSIPTEGDLGELEMYKNNGGSFFIQSAENLLNTRDWELKIQALEALRYFLRKANRTGLILIGKALKFIQGIL